MPAQDIEKAKASQRQRVNPFAMEIVTLDECVLRVDRFIPKGDDARGFAVVGNRIFTKSLTDPDAYACVDELFSSEKP